MRRKQAKLQIQKDNEARELELQKMRIDQMYSDKLEAYRKEQQSRFDKDRRNFEDEKRKRL